LGIPRSFLISFIYVKNNTNRYDKTPCFSSYRIEALIEYSECKEAPENNECKWIKKLKLSKQNQVKIKWMTTKDCKDYLFVEARLKTLRDIVRAKYDIKDNLGERIKSIEEMKKEQ